MAEITIPQKELDKVKNKLGVYKQLSRPNQKPPAIRFSDVLLPIIENAFREYARAHKGCTKQIEDKAWKDFLSKLRRYL
jgi:hypothetical protein